jgi:hypothetical protein
LNKASDREANLSLPTFGAHLSSTVKNAAITGEGPVHHKTTQQLLICF